MRQSPGSGPLRVNPIALVMVAVIASAALPYLGPIATGSILSLGFVAYGGLLVARGQRVVGAMFIVAAIAIVAVLLVRGDRL